MKQSIVLILGLLVGFILTKRVLFSPSKRKNKQGFRKRYEERKKEKSNTRDESLHQNR